MEFINLLTEKLKQKNISAYKICNDLDIGQSTFSSWKKGKKPTIEKLIAICQYLEVSSDELLGLKESTLTDEERQLIEAYRKASKLGKQTIQELARFESTRGNLSDSRPNEAGEKIG